MNSVQKICAELQANVDEFGVMGVEDGYIRRVMRKNNTWLLMSSALECETAYDSLIGIELINKVGTPAPLPELLQPASLADLNTRNRNAVPAFRFFQNAVCEQTLFLLDGNHDATRILHAVNIAAGIKPAPRPMGVVIEEMDTILRDLFSEDDGSITASFKQIEKTATKSHWRFQRGTMLPLDYIVCLDDDGYPKLDICTPVPEVFFTRHNVDNLLDSHQYNPSDLRDLNMLRDHAIEQQSDMHLRYKLGALHNMDLSSSGGARIYVINAEEAVAVCSISLDKPISHVIVRTHTQMLAEASVGCFRAPEIDPNLHLQPAIAGLKMAAGTVAMHVVMSLYRHFRP